MGKMTVVIPARNDVPVNVRRKVAETREIDFVRLVKLPQRCFYRKHNTHQLMSIRIRKISHFRGVTVEYHATETWIVLFGNSDYTTKRIFPNQFAAG